MGLDFACECVADTYRYALFAREASEAPARSEVFWNAVTRVHSQNAGGQFVAVGALHVRPIHVRCNSSDGAFCPICTIVPNYNLFKRICHSQVLLYSALLLPICPIPLLHLFHFRHHHLKRFVVHHHHHHGCHSLQTNSNSRLPFRLCSPICNSCTFRWLPLTK